MSLAVGEGLETCGGRISHCDACRRARIHAKQPQARSDSVAMARPRRVGLGSRTARIVIRPAATPED